MSESQEDDAARSPAREFIKRRIVSQFDAALVGGPPHAEYVHRLGIPANRIHYGYDAVDNAFFEKGAAAARADAATMRARLGLPNRYILASARFIPKKNLCALVKAYAKTKARLLVCPELVILGDGPERAAIECSIVTYGVAGKVHLHGFRGYEDLPSYYGLADAFAHVSTIEQWGLVVNEAMAAGLPVVVTQTCGVGRSVLLDGKSGLIVDTNPQSIADGLFRLFAMSAEDRAAMGRAAAAAISDWGPDRFGMGLKAAVESALAAPRRSTFMPWDRLILSHLQTKSFETVA